MTVRISSACTACGACLITCPTGALTPAPRRPRVWDDACTDCLACLEVCPAGAVSPGGPDAWAEPQLCTCSPTLAPIVDISDGRFQSWRNRTALEGGAPTGAARPGGGGRR